MRRAFTLIEIMVVVAIMAITVSVAVVGFSSGKDAARVKGATRDIMAEIRYARSMALVMMQPAVITYSVGHVDDEVCAEVKVDGAKIMTGAQSDTVQTLSGETVSRDGTRLDDRRTPFGAKDEEKSLIGENGGDSMEDILFAPISKEVVKGVRLKVVKADELVAVEESAKKKASKISVFSNVDYLLGKYKDHSAAEKKAEEEKKSEEEKASGDKSASIEDDQEPVSFIWESNGRCEPHKVWVYLDGKDPESGLCISVDRFGAAKVLSEEDDE